MTISGNLTYNRYRVRRNTTEPGFSFEARNDQVSQTLLIPGLGGRRLVPVPAGFEYTPPFNIYKRSNVRFETDINIESYMVTPSVEYYLSPTGDDSNDGLSAGSPKKSIGVLLDALNASPPTGATLHLAAGTYSGVDGTNLKSIDFPCNMICESGRAIVTNIQSVTWTKESGATNLWRSSAVDINTTSVVDLSDLDNYGIPRRLFPVADSATADTTPRSMAAATTTRILVHTFDGREPDASVIVFGSNSSRIYRQTTGQNLFFRNIDFWGGIQPVQINHNGSGNFVMENCSLRYARTTNGFVTESAAVSGLVTIFRNCDCSYNSLDGWNYNGSHRAIEINCKGVWNGYTKTNTNDNGTSAHGSVRTVRVNGEYAYNDDRNVHDIATSRNWLLGCRAGFAQNGLTTHYDNAAFLVGSNTSNSTTLTWLDGCISLGGVVTDLGSYDNSIARVRNGVNLVNTDGDGTIEAF